MKFSLLLAVILSFIAAAAFAQTTYPYPAKKKNKPTPEQIDEAFALFDQCEASDAIKKYYDCDCLGRIFLDLRASRPNDSHDSLMNAARLKCPNTTDIAGSSYQRCMSWAPRSRGDYEAYCTCYANNFARNFSKRPTDSIKGREILMARALTGCNDKGDLAESRTRRRLIEELKQQGLYEALFPGARIEIAPEPVQPPN